MFDFWLGYFNASDLKKNVQEDIFQVFYTNFTDSERARETPDK